MSEPTNEPGNIFADLQQRIWQRASKQPTQSEDDELRGLLMEASYAIDKLHDIGPVIDRLQERLEKGYAIEHENYRWRLRTQSGFTCASGKTLREMLIELIFVE